LGSNSDFRQRCAMAIITLAACAGSLLIALPYLRNPSIGGMEALGPMLGFFVALTIPVTAIVIVFMLWRNARWNRRTPLDIMMHSALLGVLEMGLLAWPNSGSGILCRIPDPTACIRRPGCTGG